MPTAKRLSFLTASILFAAAGCSEVATSPVVEVAPSTATTDTSGRASHKTRIEFRIDDREEAFFQKREANVQKLRVRLIGCQQWTPEADGRMAVRFVEAVQFPVRKGGNGRLNFVAAFVQFEGASEHSRVLCMLPAEVEPTAYLEALRTRSRSRGNAVTFRVSSEQYQRSTGTGSPALHYLVGLVDRFVPSASQASYSTASGDPQPLAPVIVVAFRDPFFFGAFIQYGGGEPDPYNYGNPEEEMLEEADEDYCPTNDCWENGNPYEGCPQTPTFTPETNNLINSFNAMRTTCDAALATPDRLCIDIYIHTCYTGLFNALQGDCRESSLAENRHRSRARLVVDLGTGSTVGSTFIGDTCDRLGLCFAPLGNNSVSAGSFLQTTNITGTLTNSHPLFGALGHGPAINFNVSVTKDGTGINILYVGDGYPTLAFSRGANGSWNAPKVMAEGSFWSLMGSNSDRVCLFRL